MDTSLHIPHVIQWRRRIQSELECPKDKERAYEDGSITLEINLEIMRMDIFTCSQRVDRDTHYTG